MISIAYVISPLPMIETIETICQVINQQSVTNTNSITTTTTNAASESISIPLTSFQNEVWEMNIESIEYILNAPYRREKIAELFLNQPG